jgi:LEA14-like dessication related protein
MSDEEKSKSWWYTLPGVITSLTATITALTGLVVAIRQTGWFGLQTPPAITTSSTSAPAALPNAAAPVVPAQNPPRVTSPTSPARPAYSVGLPAMRDYKLGTATFTLLKAEVSPQTTEKSALQIRVRMMNDNRFDTNFWDRSFRLIVNGVPIAPESTLNEVVPAQSAKEGDVIFVVPRGTTDGKLKITYADESTEIPLALESPR